MKKIIILAISCMLMIGIAYAQTGQAEEDYQNLDQLRRKLVRMKKEMDRFMKDIITTYPVDQKNILEDFGQDVKVDVVEQDKDIIVKADLPGMEKDKIDITLENNRMLKIAGSREMMASQTLPGMVRQERMRGKFERILELPAECMSDGIKATYQSGVLEITIPKSQKTKEERVKISVQ